MTDAPVAAGVGPCARTQGRMGGTAPLRYHAMTTQAAAFPRSSASGDFAAISRIGAVAAATIFALTGLVLVALAAAFPLALTVVEQQGLAVPAADLALAKGLGPLWPIFLAGGVASIVAAFGALNGGVLGTGIAIVTAGTAFGLASAAQIALVGHGAEAAVASAAAGVSLVALIASVIVRPRAA